MNAQQRWGQTALMLAAREGHSSVVKFLLDSGSNVRLKDKNGDSALNIALDNDNPDIVMQLRRAGAKAQIKKSSPVQGVEEDEEEEDDSTDMDDLISDEDIPDDVDLDDEI